MNNEPVNSIFREAEEKDLVLVLELLKSHHLPTDDISKTDIRFYVMKDDDRLIACAGLETFGEYQLLRSVAVKKEAAGKGIGSSLVDLTIKQSLKKGTKELFLLTETAEGFFKKKGFEVIGREEVPKSVKKSREFSELCPSTAICMRMKI